MNMETVVILSNHHVYTYNFRKEIIQALLDENYEVYVVQPYGKKVKLIENRGCKFIEVDLDRRGTNPFRDLKLIYSYFKIIKKIKPVAVLSYTIKPNIYGGIIARMLNIPAFPNITGLGSAVESNGKLQQFLIRLYKIAYKNKGCVFFQNEENKQFFIDNKITVEKYRVIQGSGVNLDEFKLQPYPSDQTIEFIYISRIMKEKGIEEYLKAAKYIKGKYPFTRFHILGFCEEDYEEKLAG